MQLIKLQKWTSASGQRKPGDKTSTTVAKAAPQGLSRHCHTASYIIKIHIVFWKKEELREDFLEALCRMYCSLVAGKSSVKRSTLNLNEVSEKVFRQKCPCHLQREDPPVVSDVLPPPPVPPRGPPPQWATPVTPATVEDSTRQDVGTSVAY